MNCGSSHWKHYAIALGKCENHEGSHASFDNVPYEIDRVGLNLRQIDRAGAYGSIQTRPH